MREVVAMVWPIIRLAAVLVGFALLFVHALGIAEDSAGSVLIVGVLSAAAALVSAATALTVSRRAANADRARLARETSLAASRVVVAASDVGALGDELVRALRGLFSLVGGLGGEKAQSEEIRTKQSTAVEMKAAAQSFLDSKSGAATDAQLSDRLMAFESNLAHLERVAAVFTRRLDTVETERLNYLDRPSRNPVIR
jgi:hypothetical protein